MHDCILYLITLSKIVALQRLVSLLELHVSICIQRRVESVLQEAISSQGEGELLVDNSRRLVLHKSQVAEVRKLAPRVRMASGGCGRQPGIVQ